MFEAIERYGNITVIYGNITVCYGPNFTGKLAVTFVADFFIIAVCLLLEILLYQLFICWSLFTPSQSEVGVLGISCS